MKYYRLSDQALLPDGDAYQLVPIRSCGYCREMAYSTAGAERNGPPPGFIRCGVVHEDCERKAFARWQAERPSHEDAADLLAEMERAFADGTLYGWARNILRPRS